MSDKIKNNTEKIYYICTHAYTPKGYIYFKKNTKNA